jgi:hypothetical protein
MAIITQPQPDFVCDYESERDSIWPDGSRVFCKDTQAYYILLSGVFINLKGTGGGGGPHTHPESDVINLPTDLSGKASTSHAHAEADVTNLATDLAGKAPTSHTHTESNVTNLTADLAGKAATAHTHAEADTTGLVTDLAGKAPTTHSHAEADVTSLVTDLAGKAPLVSPSFTTPTIGAALGTSLKLSGRMRDAIVASLVTTVGATTFTAAQFTGGLIIRSGSTAAYSDTTPTAAAIVGAIPNCAVGTAFELTIRNTVAFIETILAGSGVTLSQTTAVAASQTRRYLCVVTNVGTPAVTLYGIGGSPL